MSAPTIYKKIEKFLYLSLFIKFILLFEIAFLLTVVYEFDIFLLRAIISILQISFIPGCLIFILANSQRETELSTFIVHSLGSSLVFSMLVAFIINGISPFLGITHPLSSIPLAVGSFIFTIILLLFLVYFDRGISTDRVKHYMKYDIKKYDNRIIACLISMIVFAVSSGVLLRYHHNNTGILVFFVLIILIMVTSIKTLDSRYYPIVIWSVSISLLLANALSYNFLGPSGAAEYTAVKATELEGLWSPNTAVQREGNLRLHLLHPMYSQLTGLTLFASFRFIHPLLFSFTPLILYMGFKNRHSEDIAFFSVFYFMYVHVFYRFMIYNTRSATALLFVCLCVLVLLSEQMSEFSQRLFLMIFSVGMVFSHYGTSYLFLFITAAALFFQHVELFHRGEKKLNRNRVVTPLFLLFLFVLLFSWNLYAGGYFGEFVSATYDFAYTIVTLDVYSDETDAAQHLFAERAFTIVIIRYLYIISITFISLGLINEITKFIQEKNVNSEIMGGSIMIYSIIGLSASPVASPYNIDRTFMIALPLLAPFLVIGIKGLLSMIRFSLELTLDSTILSSISYKTAVIIFMTVFFVFTSGFISSTVTNEDSTNIVIDKSRVVEEGTPQERYKLFRDDSTRCDQSSSMWIWSFKNYNSKIIKGNPPHADEFALKVPIDEKLPHLHNLRVLDVEIKNNPWEEGDYIYLGEFSHRTGLVVLSNPDEFDRGFRRRPIENISVVQRSEDDRIYDGGQCSVRSVNSDE